MGFYQYKSNRRVFISRPQNGDRGRPGYYNKDNIQINLTSFLFSLLSSLFCFLSKIILIFISLSLQMTKYFTVLFVNEVYLKFLLYIILFCTFTLCLLDVLNVTLARSTTRHQCQNTQYFYLRHYLLGVGIQHHFYLSRIENRK